MWAVWRERITRELHVIPTDVTGEMAAEHGPAADCPCVPIQEPNRPDIWIHSEIN